MVLAKGKIQRKTLVWLWLLIAAGCLLIFHSYLFGNETFVFERAGSDTKNQYIMHYNTVINHLRSGNFSLWDFSNGFGANLYVVSLMNPFLAAVYLLGTLFGPEHVTLYMVYLFIFEILASGTACYFFLSCFPFTERCKLPACFMYAFNGYLIIWGQHYQLGGVLVWLPLLLMSIEKARPRRRHLFWVSVLSAVLILNGYYQGYMCMLGTGIYVTVRELLYEDGAWRGKWKRFFSVAASMLLGVCMAAVNLLPAAAQLGQTSRLTSDRSVFEKILRGFSFWGSRYYETLIYRLFGNNLQGRGVAFTGYQNYYEAASWCFSTLFVILFLQYVFTIHRQRKNARQKAAQYIGVLFGIFMVTVKTGSLMFDGFVYPFSRHTFLLMPLFALLSAAALHQILEERRFSAAAMALAAAVMPAVYLAAFRQAGTAAIRADALLLCATGFAMGAVLVLAVGNRAFNRKFCCTALLCLLFVNVVFDVMVTFRSRDTLKKDDTEYYQGTYHSSVTDALAWLAQEDPSFYRVEKDFTTASPCLDSMAQGYAGVSTYNSTQNSNIARFVAKLWPQLTTGYGKNHYKFTNTVREQTMAALVGVKYLLSREDDLAVEGYELYHQIGEISIYRNTDTESVGKFFTKTVTQKNFEAAEKKLDTWKLLKDALIVEGKDAFSISRKELSGYKEKKIRLLDRKSWAAKMEAQGEDGNSEAAVLGKNSVEVYDRHFIYLPLKQDKMEKYSRITVEFSLETDVGTEIEIRMNDDRSHVFYHKAGKKDYRFAVPKNTEQITVQITDGKVRTVLNHLRFYGTKQDSTFSDGAKIEINRTGRDSHLTGSIRASSDGIVMLAVPYEAGWSVYLDGKAQELKTGDYGFLAFEVAAGDYELELRYEAPLFRVSVAVSAAAWAAAVLLWVRRRRKE